jgi:hypothetical protein
MTRPQIAALCLGLAVLLTVAVACLVYWSRELRQSRRLARLKGEQ